ncbi:hypothetical protein CVV65_16355 [Kyrpidia spormannii]|uniref:Uncharacterized protein n=1 Tax=Kyrpidia spormannii TaxID=2055160 RepID=A0A2K8NDG0_9BACL|nr:hypothetical protein CVV65_16355 [Kyrpidia spormannii]
MVPRRPHVPSSLLDIAKVSESHGTHFPLLSGISVYTPSMYAETQDMPGRRSCQVGLRGCRRNSGGDVESFYLRLERGGAPVATFRRDVDIGRQVKLMEWIKIELLDQVSALFRACHTGAEGLIADALSGILISVYILARRVGLSPGEIDRKALEKLTKTKEIGHEAETWFGDLGAVENHLRGR